MTDLQPKLIYLARRNPALTRSQFTPRWRQHGALGMSMPRWKNIARYVHCDVLDVPRPTRALDPEPDGIGIVWHHSEAARAAHVADTSSRETMERDERETFACPVVDFCAVTHERVLVAVAPGSRPCKITRFETARDPEQGAQVAAQRVEQGSSLRARLASVHAEVRGHVINIPLPRPAGGRWGLSVDCIEELWFDDIETAVLAAEALAADQSLDNSLGVPPADSVRVLTNEVLLHEAR